MRSTEIELNGYLKGLLNRLRHVSSLDPKTAAQEREKFLAQGEIFRHAESQQPSRGQIRWINSMFFAFQRRQHIGLMSTLLVIILFIAVFVGGAGATVYAAQGSLPDEILYPVKTWSEDVRLSLAGSSQGQLELILDFTDRRVAEIARLHAAAKPVSEGVAARMQDELDAALQIAAGMDDPHMIQALVQIRQQAEIQSRTLTAWMASASGQVDPVLARLQARLQEQVQLAAAGGNDPQGFRLQVRVRLLNRQNMPSQAPKSTQPGSASNTPNATPAPTGSSYGPGPGGGSATGTPGNYRTGGSNPSQTPMPTGGSYGPGPGAGAGQSSATPGVYGPGANAGTATSTPVQNGGGSGPSPSQTPQPGGPGSISPHPSATTQPGGPGSGSGQSTATAYRGGHP